VEPTGSTAAAAAWMPVALRQEVVVAVGGYCFPWSTISSGSVGDDGFEMLVIGRAVPSWSVRFLVVGQSSREDTGAITVIMNYSMLCASPRITLGGGKPGSSFNSFFFLWIANAPANYRTSPSAAKYGIILSKHESSALVKRLEMGCVSPSGVLQPPERVFKI